MRVGLRGDNPPPDVHQGYTYTYTYTCTCTCTCTYTYTYTYTYTSHIFNICIYIYTHVYIYIHLRLVSLSLSLSLSTRVQRPPRDHEFVQGDASNCPQRSCSVGVPKQTWATCQWRFCIVCCISVVWGVFLWSRWNFPAWCSGCRRPLIAGCLSRQRLGIDLTLTRPVWDSNLRPPASESRSIATELLQPSYPSHWLTVCSKVQWTVLGCCLKFQDVQSLHQNRV